MVPVGSLIPYYGIAIYLGRSAIQTPLETAVMTGIGKSVRRKEDRRFITGAGNYTGDVNYPNQGYLYILRAQTAHSQIRGIDTSAALAAEGVVAVYTAADLDAGGVRDMQPAWMIYNPDGSPMHDAPREALARERIRSAGNTLGAHSGRHERKM